MNIGTKESGELALLQMPENIRCKLVKQVKERLRQEALEAKMWHELLQVDNLTINGIIVWKENQQPKERCTKARKKKTSQHIRTPL